LAVANSFKYSYWQATQYTAASNIQSVHTPSKSCLLQLPWLPHKGSMRDGIVAKNANMLRVLPFARMHQGGVHWTDFHEILHLMLT
jgi:hypothetical protein